MCELFEKISGGGFEKVKARLRRSVDQKHYIRLNRPKYSHNFRSTNSFDVYFERIFLWIRISTNLFLHLDRLKDLEERERKRQRVAEESPASPEQQQQQQQGVPVLFSFHEPGLIWFQCIFASVFV